MAFVAANLLHRLHSLPTPRGYLVAFSGGLDSHVLLHALVRVRDQLQVPVRAIHVHHGLQDEADRWQLHCEAVCAELDVPLHTENLDLQPQGGESIEAVARSHRYAAIAANLNQQEMLLTAQHQDDQAETLLLQLLRGSGIQGLAAMPLWRQWHAGWHARPLLETPRDALYAYAVDHALQWLEDPSNQDQRFDRNYLRHSVMPMLRARWPATSPTLARSARLLADTLETLAELADSDLQQCLGESGRPSVRALARLPTARRKEAIRSWVRSHHLPVPDHARMLEIEKTVFSAGPNASPMVRWADVSLRRYRDCLWLLPAELALPTVAELSWPDVAALPLGNGLGVLRRTPGVAGIPDRYWQQGCVRIGWRSGDEQCRPRGRQGSRTFRKLCQDLGIPPWERDRVPLIYVENVLVAVADYCLCGDLPGATGDTFSQIHWEH